MKNLFLVFLLCAKCVTINAQNLFIYQPRKGDEIKVFDSEMSEITSKAIHMKQGEILKIKFINPNPIFYKYELTCEEQKEETENKELTDALSLLGEQLLSRISTAEESRNRSALVLPQKTAFQLYKENVEQLKEDIKAAVKIVDDSDIPEPKKDVEESNRTAGLRYAIDQITGKVNNDTPLKLPDSPGRFNSNTLLSDLNALLDKASGLEELSKSGLILLNNSLVQKVNELKHQMSEIKSEMDVEFVVTDKPIVVYLRIVPIDPKRDNARTIVEEKIAITTVVPDFKRSVIELFPVGNFLFSENVKEFYLEDNIIHSRSRSKTLFNAGAVININCLNFGESKEISLGVGPGYKLSNSNGLENFYLSAMISYKNIVRIGLGVGFAQFPNDLKNDLHEGQTLPSDIGNLNDMINYHEKLTGFLTIAFSGLNLTKKK